MTQEQTDAEVSSFEQAANQKKIKLKLSMKADKIPLPDMSMTVDMLDGLKAETPIPITTTYIAKKSKNQLW